MVQACQRIEHVGDVVILSAGGANAAARSLAFASQASAPNSAAGLPAMIGQRALGVRRKRRFVVAPLAAALILPAASPALGANTDIYPDFGFTSPPGWQYQNYFDVANQRSVTAPFNPSLTLAPATAGRIAVAPGSGQRHRAVKRGGGSEVEGG